MICVQVMCGDDGGGGGGGCDDDDDDDDDDDASPHISKVAMTAAFLYGAASALPSPKP